MKNFNDDKHKRNEKDCMNYHYNTQSQLYKDHPHWDFYNTCVIVMILVSGPQNTSTWLTSLPETLMPKIDNFTVP